MIMCINYEAWRLLKYWWLKSKTVMVYNHKKKNNATTMLLSLTLVYTTQREHANMLIETHWTCIQCGRDKSVNDRITPPWLLDF
jgi:hypothetical protein